ncbi:hypothetical protein BT67DRAFT_276060 [Trichocladium antarcticum]|uniref:Uncharacterized protein n=1 Tax=Trichocladium antarcticum TaxID=1450529 RepID=A0AAN6UMJ8_9PEZI|nr:hypothetical protein BT67DRAFT_276060 [Trichocladium antarcticum]
MPNCRPTHKAPSALPQHHPPPFPRFINYAAPHRPISHHKATLPQQSHLPEHCLFHSSGHQPVAKRGARLQVMWERDDGSRISNPNEGGASVISVARHHIAAQRTTAAQVARLGPATRNAANVHPRTNRESGQRLARLLHALPRAKACIATYVACHPVAAAIAPRR